MFDFHLARLLHMTVGELRARMSMREHQEWAAVLGLEAERAKHARKLSKARG